MCTKKIEHTFDRKEVCIMIIEKDLGGYFKYVVIGDDVLVDPLWMDEYKRKRVVCWHSRACAIAILSYVAVILGITIHVLFCFKS